MKLVPAGFSTLTPRICSSERSRQNQSDPREGWFPWLPSLIRRAIKEVERPAKRHTHTHTHTHIHTLSSLGTVRRLVFLPTSHWGDFCSKTRLHSSLLFRFSGLDALSRSRSQLTSAAVISELNLDLDTGASSRQ